MLLLFAILFGSLTAPEIAHAEDTGGETVAVVDDAHRHDTLSEQGKHEQKGDAPCKALVHHHCSIALAADADVYALEAPTDRSAMTPSISQPMASLALAPPTEPPAA